MKINTQNLSFLQRNIQRTGFQRGAQNHVSTAAVQELDRYYHSAGNAVDNLTCMESQIKYMKSAYDKAWASSETSKAETIDKWMQAQYDDMSWLVTSSLGISHFRIATNKELYGGTEKEEESPLLGLLDGTDELLQELKGAGNTADALARLFSVKEQLMQRADYAADLYGSCTGRQLSPYTYKTAADYAGVKWDSHILYNRELGDIKGSGLSVNLNVSGKIDLSEPNAAPNLIDIQA